jgi:hypothetical protein
MARRIGYQSSVSPPGVIAVLFGGQTRIGALIDLACMSTAAGRSRLHTVGEARC